MKYPSPRDHAGFFRGTTSEEEREAVLSSISPGFFRSFEFECLSKYVDGSGPPDEFPTLSPVERAHRESLLRQRFQRDRVTVREIPGDSACLFRSLADQIYRVHGTVYHLHFRRLACDWIAKNRDAIAGFCADRDLSIDEHISQMRCPANYGTNIELAALSAILRREIHVYLFEFIEPHVIRHESVSTTSGPPL